MRAYGQAGIEARFKEQSVKAGRAVQDNIEVAARGLANVSADIDPFSSRGLVHFFSC